MEKQDEKCSPRTARANRKRRRNIVAKDEDDSSLFQEEVEESLAVVNADTSTDTGNKRFCRRDAGGRPTKIRGGERSAVAEDIKIEEVEEDEEQQAGKEQEQNQEEDDEGACASSSGQSTRPVSPAASSLASSAASSPARLPEPATPTTEEEEAVTVVEYDHHLEPDEELSQPFTMSNASMKPADVNDDEEFKPLGANDLSPRKQSLRLRKRRKRHSGHKRRRVFERRSATKVRVKKKSRKTVEPTTTTTTPNPSTSRNFDSSASVTPSKEQPQDVVLQNDPFDEEREYSAEEDHEYALASSEEGGDVSELSGDETQDDVVELPRSSLSDDNPDPANGDESDYLSEEPSDEESGFRLSDETESIAPHAHQKTPAPALAQSQPSPSQTPQLSIGGFPQSVAGQFGMSSNNGYGHSGFIDDDLLMSMPHPDILSPAFSFSVVKKKKIYPKVPRLLLDDALKDPVDQSRWSSARKRAWKTIKTNPNSYYYRFNAPGEVQAGGVWNKEEEELFFKRIDEVGVGDNWGIFAMGIPGRVGYQCSNFYRKMIKEGRIFDSNYQVNNGKLLYKRVTKSRPTILSPPSVSVDSGAAVQRVSKKRSRSHSTKKYTRKRVVAQNTDHDALWDPSLDNSTREGGVLSAPPPKRRKKKKKKKRIVEKLPPEAFYNFCATFVDMITKQQVMKPAISPYGHVLGWETWMRVLRQNPKDTCPFTKKPLKRRQLFKLNIDNFGEYRSKIKND